MVEKQGFKVLTYSQALELVIPMILDLIGKRKLKEFCHINNLNYKVVVMMGSKKNHKEFPDTLHQLLEVFGHKTEREKAFKIYE